MSWRQAVWLALGGLLAGCAHYQAKPLDVAGMQDARTHRDLTTPATQQLLVRAGLLHANDRWPRTSFSHAQLLVIALANNPDVAEARTQIERSVQGVRSAGALPNPDLSLAFERDTQANAESQPWLWGISSNFVLGGAARRRLDVALAQADVRAATLALNESVWKLRDGLRRAEVDLLIADRQCRLAERGVQTAGALDDAYALRVRAGEAASGERFAVTQMLNQARTTQATCSAARLDAQARLARLLDVGLPAIQGIAVAWPDFDTPANLDNGALDQLAQQARLTRPDLQAALVAYDAREIALAQQVHAQYPQLSVGPGYTFDHGIRKLTLGLSASLPIFNQNQGPIAEALAQREAAGQHAQAVQADVDNDIALSRAQWTNSQHALQLAEQGHAQAVRDTERAAQAVRAGAADRLAQWTATLGDIAAGQTELTALALAHQAETTLESALRAPLDADEARLSNLLKGSTL